MHTIFEKKLLMLKPSQIKIPTDRMRKNMDTYSIKLLADSISLNGVIEPITVRKGEDGFFYLISGERRLKAATLAGLRRVPCVAHKIDAITCSVYSLIENLQRSNLDYFEEAAALERLITVYGLPKAEVSMRLSIPNLALCQKLDLLKLGIDIREKLITFKLDSVYAYLLLKLPDYKRTEVLNKIISENLTVQDTQELINNILYPPFEDEPPKEETKPVRKYYIGDVRLFSNTISKLVENMQTSGINATLKKTENDKYTEYKIRIKKEDLDYEDCQQLKIC